MNRYITPLVTLFLILLMEFVLPIFPFYNITLNILYLAFFLNAFYDCGRVSNMIAASMMILYAGWLIPDQPFRLVVFSFVTLSIGYGDGIIKERLREAARTTERLRLELTYQTQEVRRKNEQIAEIKALGSEIASIVKRMDEARVALTNFLEHRDEFEKVRVALHRINEAQTMVQGYRDLAKSIEVIKQRIDDNPPLS